MCLLTYFEPGVQPNTYALATGATLNDDGHGYAIVHDGRIIIGKGLNGPALIEEFARMRALYPTGPALFHSRMTTHGLSNVDNCHPFYVDGDKRTVVAHNGILPRDVQPDRGDPRSDTAILAASMAGRFGSLRKPQVRRHVELWMGSYNKLVVLTVNPRFGGNAFILNEEAGIWTPEGIWYSNDGYKLSGRRWSYLSGDDGWTKDATGGWYYDKSKDKSVVGGTKSTMDNDLCWVCSGTEDTCTCYAAATASDNRDRWTGTGQRRGLPKLDGHTECWGCHNPRQYCDCPPTNGTRRCTGCFYWLTQSDLKVEQCGVCGTCLACDLPNDKCDCYAPASTGKALALIDEGKR